MSLQNKQTELDEARPDRLASSMLIIGIIIVSQFVLYSIIFYIVGGRLPPPYILPFIFVGGIGIVYGSLRIVRGSSVTKQLVKATLIKMRAGGAGAWADVQSACKAVIKITGTTQPDPKDVEPTIRLIRSIKTCIPFSSSVLIRWQPKRALQPETLRC